MTADVFISYSTKDAVVAEATREALEAQGMSCWIAPRNIKPGQDWSAAIIDGIEEARAFLLIFSRHSNESEQVKREVQNAVSQRLPILPFRVEDVELTRQMRYFIGTPHWLNAVEAPLEPHLTELVTAMRSLLAGQETEKYISQHVPFPTGLITLVFTDIQGSSSLWEKNGDAFSVVLSEHNRLMRHAAAHWSGVEVKTEGDAFFLVFSRAENAVQFAIDAQKALAAHDWNSLLPGLTELRVRIGMHSGTPIIDRHPDGKVDYFGPVVNRAARVGAAGFGAQTVVSDATWQLVQGSLPPEVSSENLGRHLLKGVGEETLWQILHPALLAKFPPLPTLITAQHNLPQTLSSFIGRQKEKEEVKQLLSESRLVTLCGGGGSGKTRLAIEVGHELFEDYPDGAWLVELESLTSPDLVPQAIAGVLEVREEPGRTLADTLAQSLQARHLLLLLDNCEHLVEPVAHLVTSLLRTCPKVRILATSREALSIAGEVPWRLPALPLPDLKKLPPLDKLANFEVVQLFVERARSHTPNFALTGQNAAAVAQICVRLDGIPLAIELACARIKMMPPDKIAARLDDCFRLLTGGSRTALPRQQTLRAAIDWSYELLDERERILFRRTAIFSGGFTMEAAEVVCADEYLDAFDVLDFLAQLVDKSLVVAEEAGDGMRYRLLETVRAYGGDKLREGDEEMSVKLRHAQWFLKMAEEAVPGLQGNDPGPWLELLDVEQDNVRAAFETLLQQESPEDAARLCLALTEFWERRGWFSESRASLARCLDKEDQLPPDMRAKLHREIGWFAYLMGNYTEAENSQKRALEIFKQEKDTKGEAEALNDLGLTAHVRGALADARQWMEEAVALTRQVDLKNLPHRLCNLALIEIADEQFDTAETLLEEASTLFSKNQDDHGAAGCLCNLAELDLRRGIWTDAVTHSRESLTYFRRLEDQRGVAFSLANLAEAAAHQPALAGYDETANAILEALTICGDSGMEWLAPIVLESRALWCANRGELNSAQFSFAAADKLRTATGQEHMPEEALKLSKIEELLPTDTIPSEPVPDSLAEIMAHIS